MSGAQNGNGAGSAILAEVKALREQMDRLMAHFGLGDNGRRAPNASGNVASVRDIQGDRGDPKIGKMPRNWTGDNFEGCSASECSPDFLDFYADFLDWKANNPRPGKEKYAEYDRRDAARCRRWGIEIREGRTQQGKPKRAASPPPDGDTVWSHGSGGPSPDDDAGMPPPPDDYNGGGFGSDDSDVPF